MVIKQIAIILFDGFAFGMLLFVLSPAERTAFLVEDREALRAENFLPCSGVAAMLAGPAIAQNVDWKDDGTVVLKLGEAYNNATIQTTREELGSEFGPDKKPFKDVTITVTVNGAGPKGGISGPLHQFRPIWEELSGGKVNIVELPFAEHYTKMMLDLRNGTGQYDAFMVGAFWYGDIVPAGYGYAIDELQASGKYPKWTYDDMPPSLKALHQWKGVGYGVLNDGDGQVLYYRSDMLSDRRASGSVQEGIRLRSAQSAADLAAIARYLQVLQRQELGCDRCRSRQRRGSASEGWRAGPLSLPVALRRPS